jgi:molecular chaperone GrpE
LSDKNNSSGDDEPIEIESVGPADQASSSGDTAALEKKILALTEELTKSKNDQLYLRADFDNYRKSVIKERSDLIKYGSERVFVELLDVLDNFERALQVELTPETLNTFKEGLVLTANELKRALNKFGVNDIECDGAPFDPAIHEALSSEETDRVAPGHVARVFKKAYKLHDRVIRPAQVVVATAPSK